MSAKEPDWSGIFVLGGPIAITRSTTLLPGSFTEIFRYEGPTGTTLNNGTSLFFSGSA